MGTPALGSETSTHQKTVDTPNKCDIVSPHTRQVIDMHDDDEDMVSGSDRTAEDLSHDLRNALSELGWSAAALMDRMRSLGDYRTPATILRGINRALEGEIKPSGELMALVQQAVRFQRRLMNTHRDVVWKELADGSYTALIEDFAITLLPQTRGRWKVNLAYRKEGHKQDGYSPYWPRFQESLDAAKRIAFITLDNGQNWLLENA